MLKQRLKFRPNLEALEERWTPSTARPISDFIDAQGTTSFFPNGINAGGPAGMPDGVGFTSSTATFNNGTARFVRIDYTGQDAAFLHLNLGTTTSGTISERTLPDGTAQATINLHTKNAFAWANFLGDGSDSTVIFGYLPSELAANPTLAPPLANSDFQLVFNIPHPGAPLPDLVKVATLGGIEGYTLESIALHVTATGTTPTGQQATLVVSQVGVLNRTPHLIGDFGFTAEVLDVHTHGAAPATSAPAASAPGVGPTSANSVATSAAATSPRRTPSPSAINAVFEVLPDDPFALVL